MIRRLSLAAAACAVALTVVPSSAAPAPAQVALPYNNDCIAPDGVLFVDGNCDGGGYVFTANSKVPKAGRTTIDAVPFTFPSSAQGQNNTVVGIGQTLALPGKPGYRYLHLLGFVTNGNPTDSTVTVAYTKGASVKSKIRLPDWTVKAGSSLAMDKHGPYNPVQTDLLPNVGYAYVFSVPLDAKRVVRSITLPRSYNPNPLNDPQGYLLSGGAQYQLFAMTLSASPAKKAKAGPVFN